MSPNSWNLHNLGDILRPPAHGERDAFIDLRHEPSPRHLSACEFDALCASIARGLLRRGVRRGARIGILSENRVEFIASYLGIMRMGAVAVPVNYKLPRTTIEHIFRDSEIELAFADSARRPQVPATVPIIDLDGEDGDGFEALLDAGPVDTFLPAATDLAEILYTSGSTGLPKGVPLAHHGQLWAIGHYLDAIPAIAPQETTIVVAPLYHMNGLFNMSVALARRIAIISLPRFDARRYLETAARYRCTVLSGIPTMFALMVREHDLVERLDFASVREVTIGSAPLTDALLEQTHRLFPNAQIKNGFGTTEAGPAVFGPHPQGRARPPLSLGYPFADVECKLVDGPSSDEGVLALRTEALMHGYLNQPAATASRMRDGWYLTGDLMRRDPEGFYFFVGRADDMFVCGGENVYPGEVEKMLERHPAVAQAIVVAAADDIKGQIPVAFIVPRQGAMPSVEEIKHYALREGPAYAHPRFIEYVEALPLSGTHKIDRASLTAEAARIVRAAGRSQVEAARVARPFLTGILMDNHLDHIIWVCDDLARGARRFTALTGVEPQFGGVHASGLTHNALVPLGGRTYLEILAPVGPAAPDEDQWCRLARTAVEPRVLTYCLRSSKPLDEIAALAAKAGWRNAVVASNARTTPAGVRLQWQWLAPVIERFGLAFPFFIDWRDSPHPADTGPAPAGGSIRLRRFAVGHPDAAALHRTLTELGAPVDTYAATAAEFVVELDTPRGRVSL